MPVKSTEWGIFIIMLIGEAFLEYLSTNLLCLQKKQLTNRISVEFTGI